MDVVIVGAGLAGLACARRLRAALASAHPGTAAGQGADPGGLSVTVLEASDRPGGRVRSDVVDGFTLDRGFQLLNPAYPETQRVLDLPRLRLQSFPAEVAVATGSRVLTLADPLREPLRTPSTLASVASGRFGTPREHAAFVRWAMTAGRGDVHQFLDGPDRGWKAGLDEQGVDGELRQRVLEPFLAGVVGERAGETSHRFVDLLVRSFMRGRPAVPWRGMQAISDQLAEGLDIEYGVNVTGAGPGVVRTADGERSARAVVIAADPVTAASLLDLPAPQMRPLTTFWHVAPTAPTKSRALRLDGDARGPLVNTVVISNTADSYSPDRRALIASTALGTAKEADVAEHLRILYPGADVGAWELLRVDELPRALTALPPPMTPQKPVDLGDGLFVAGDHRDTSSIQGALVSGRRAADAVLSSLGIKTPA